MPPMEKLFRKWAFKPSMVADAPDTAGIYALWNGDQLLFVGRAGGGEDTLQARLTDHLEHAASGSAPAPTHYSWEICDPRERLPQLDLHASGSGAA
jgi:hypothetical protein